MRLSDFDYNLPSDLIAQEPRESRDQSRLLSIDRRTGTRSHCRVSDLSALLTPGDLLVVNNTRVFPARLLGHRVPSGGAVECLLLSRLDDQHWDVLMHPGQKLKPGALVLFEGAAYRLYLEVLERRFHGRRTVRLTVDGDGDVDSVIDAIGHVPLPPYIRRSDEQRDRERYQTVFARVRGSIAAPTAGLHFTPALLEMLAARKIERAEITLHVGYGTFQPIRSDQIEQHQVAEERFEITAGAADRINAARAEGRRIVAVGTTSTRALESAVRVGNGRIESGTGLTDLYIYPGFDFRVVTALLTNFHLPRSSLLVLVCAFAGRKPVMAAYRDAVACRYRFYSYGDAMFIT